ncbi:MAG: hypothetical protein J6L58_02700 [Clostridia bacterium]|nr:hypothetical protein [Clostridia bacterium]
MEIKQIGKIVYGQDGAVFGGYLFRFNHKSECTVYLLEDFTKPLAEFKLDKADIINPHSNSVMFGNTRYSEEDEFPLLYTNIYNNHAGFENKLKGVTCVYRLQRNGNDFTSTLLQTIEIGFTEDDVWKSKEGDARPYGNFVIDYDKSLYYAFTMRNEEPCTRFFAFTLPTFRDGVYDETLGIKRVTFEKTDIINTFDIEYQHYLQGATMENGVIYSLEGFSDDKNNPPAIRLIDTKSKQQTEVHFFADFGTWIEPEFIDFENGVCYYSDCKGNLYNLTF